jgi:hypothetical protein
MHVELFAALLGVDVVLINSLNIFTSHVMTPPLPRSHIFISPL